MTPEEAREIVGRLQPTQQEGQDVQGLGARLQPMPAPNPELRNKLKANVDAYNQRIENEQNEGLSGIASIPAQIGAASMNVGRSIWNLPNTLSGGKIAPSIDPNYDYYKALGVKKGITGSIAEPLIEYSPFGGGAGAIASGVKYAPKILSKAPQAIQKGLEFTSKALNKLPGSAALKSNVIGGAAYSGAQGENPLIGGAVGALSHGAGKALEKGVVQPLAKAYSQSAIPGLVKNATKSISESAPLKSFAKQFQGAYKTAKDAATSNWQKTDTMAKNLDAKLASLPRFKDGKNFATPYRQYVDNFINSKKALSPAQRRQYEDAIKLAEDFRLDAPRNLADAVALRQNANQYVEKFVNKQQLKQSDAKMEQFLEGLKRSLDKSVPKNVPSSMKPELKAFQNQWKDANKATQRKHDFYEGNKTGTPGEIDFNRGLKASLESGKADAGVFSKFTPKATDEGAEGVRQLGNLFGDKEKGAAAMRSYLERTIEKGADPLAIIRKLSPQQRKVIYGNSPEGKDLMKALEIEQKFGTGKTDAFEKAISHLGLAGIPGAGVFGAELLMGKSPGEASKDAGIAATLAYLGGRGAGKFAHRNPKALNKAIKLAEKGVDRPGSAINFVAQPTAQAIWGKGSEENK